MPPRTVPGDSFSAIIDKVSKNAWLKNQIKTYEFIEENQFKDFSSVANYKDLYSFKRDAYNDAFGVKRDQIIV